MSSLNNHANVALKIAKQRAKREAKRFDSIELLKHAAGEVIEATEAYNNYFNYSEDHYKKDLAGELADIITCTLIVAAMNRIDIEDALRQCQIKNYNRAKE